MAEGSSKTDWREKLKREARAVANKKKATERRKKRSTPKFCGGDGTCFELKEGFCLLYERKKAFQSCKCTFFECPWCTLKMPLHVLRTIHYDNCLSNFYIDETTREICKHDRAVLGKLRQNNPVCVNSDRNAV